MGDDEPEFLYHYTTREAAFGSIVPRTELRFSPIQKMRDPLENQPWRISAGVSPALLDTGDEFATFWKAQKELDVLKIRAKLLALTLDAEGHPDPWGRGWARARLWEQYGETHEGVCLRFDKRRLIDALDAALESADSTIVYAKGDVDYSEAGPVTASRNINLNESLRDDVKAGVARHISAYERELFFNKTLDWETEHEFRFVLIDASRRPRTSKRVKFANALDAVIVGHEFPDWQTAAALEACNEAGVESLKVSWDGEMPKLRKLRTLEERKRDAAQTRALLDRLAADPGNPVTGGETS